MKNSLRLMSDKFYLVNAVIITLNDELKNIYEIEHSRHKSRLVIFSQL
ncbi:transposase [uncultured Nonlabens sp.]